MAGELLEQFRENLDKFIPREKLLYTRTRGFSAYFGGDEDVADVSWERTISRDEDGYAYSLFLSYLYQRYQERDALNNSDIDFSYPRGIPGYGADISFLLEDATTWLQENLGKLPQPYMGYFHFLPPHFPYRTHRDFYNQFLADGFAPAEKPPDMYANLEFQSGSEAENRTLYDEFILHVDSEFGRLFDQLEASGMLGNTWVVLTSDHGEMFERGVQGHQTPLLYEPVIRIPLMIFEPGRKSRADVHVPTSAVDVLSTLLHVTGQEPAAWTEGSVLPPFSNAHPVPDRNVYVLEAKNNKQFAPFTMATTALRKENFKLIYFFGYKELGATERIELYDLKADPEEMNNLFRAKRETARDMLHELNRKLGEVNEPYL
jgi:arylsulfatase A-like enzyme